MHLKYLYGPKNNKGKVFILNLLKSGVCCKAKATESGPRRKWKVSNEAELVSEEAGQARGVGKEGQEPPNTSKMHTASVEVWGRAGVGATLAPAAPSRRQARPSRKGIRAKRRGRTAAGSAMTYGINFHPLPLPCLPRLLLLSPRLGALTSPLLCRSGLK